MPGLPCTAPDCAVETQEGTLAEMIQLLTLHTQVAHGRGTAAASSQKAPPITRPKVESGISEENWQVFTQRWELFKNGASLDARHVNSQLFDCCEDSLQTNLLKESTQIASLTEAQVLNSIKSLAVIPVAIGVRRAELLGMTQDSSENARSFHAKVKGKADTCAYKVKCGCDEFVEFTDIIVKDVFVGGLSDDDIKREVLGWTELDTSTIAQTIKYVEGKEMARDAMSSAKPNVAGVSTFKKNNRSNDKEKNKEDEKSDAQIAQDLKKMAKCPDCAEQFNLFKKMGKSKKLNRTPFTKCRECFLSEKGDGDKLGGISLLGRCPFFLQVDSSP